MRARTQKFLLLGLFLSFVGQSVANDFTPEQTAHCRVVLAPAYTLEQGPIGPILKAPAPLQEIRDFESIRELKIGQFNVLNLYNYRGRWKRERGTGRQVWDPTPKAKPEKRWTDLENVIDRSDDDIMIWEEVEDIAAAQDFVNTRLGGKYRVFLINGNDARGIDIAVLVKSDLPLDLEIHSHRDLKIEGTPLFSRDLPVVYLKKPGSTPKDPPLLVLAGTHFKSQRDRSGDPGSVLLRTAQAEGAARVLTEVESRHPQVPIFLLGDFNADVPSADEFKALWTAGFKDSFDLGEVLHAAGNRVTHTYHGKGEPTKYHQLDAILASKAAQRPGIVLKTEIIPYVDANGVELPPAPTFRQRDKQGSDHRKLRMTIDFKKLIEGKSASLRPRLYDLRFDFSVREVVALQSLDPRFESRSH